MAFDTETRGKLQRFVTDIRALLTDDFTRQLQQTYGMDPVSGEVASIEGLNHLDDERLETAQILRDIMDHYLASEAKNEQQTRISVLRRIAREQAFTILNRLAALRMMEARGILLESIAQGTQSQAFRLYQQVANGSLGDTGVTYRHFLYSLFDLFAADLPSLFDRYGPQSRLFPREVTLTKALDLINGSTIEPLWAEDETIGWIYQYFNSKEERKAMRDASQAPRNSRELAVRNQFFTPRYVVEFLVDNTLGRLWFDWTGGQTGLRDRCQYLLVKPDEQPEAAERLRDPRTIKLLDPACGSMHFGLYAFDLFLEIYREAWAWEQAHGPGCLDAETGGSANLKPLSQTYVDQDALLHDVPRLIIEHNIYGVDIDPRAAQIASLALWLRAQRAWNESGVKAQDRPQVGRGHVVAAIAPPAEVDMRKRFMEKLDPLDAELFEKTLFLLKGLPELGVLMQVEKELPALVRAVFGEHGDLFREEDMVKWQLAETRLQEALSQFARAARSTYQGRLFAEDALQGLRMIDHCREVYDVVVMNPPFGEPAAQVKAYQKLTYPSSKQDIFQCFVERSLELTRDRGMVGVLSARTGFFMGDSESWRTKIVWENQLQVFADLGLGVLDDALVEAAAYVIKRGKVKGAKILASRHLATREKEESLLQSIYHTSQTGMLPRDSFEISQELIERIPGGVFGYWAPVKFLKRFSAEQSFGENVAPVRQGLATANDFRFVRLAWEVLPTSVGREKRWSRFSKGGEYSPPYDDIHLLVDWESDGKQLRSMSSARVQNDRWYHKPGATYTVRTASAFAAKALPKGCIFSHNAQSWFVADVNQLRKSVVYFLARVPQAYLEIAVGGGDVATSGSAARRYTTRVVHSIPASILRDFEYPELTRDCDALFRLSASDQSVEETTCFFAAYPVHDSRNLSELARNLSFTRQERINQALEAAFRIDKAVSEAWGLQDDELEFVRAEIGYHPLEYNSTVDSDDVRKLASLSMSDLVQEGVNQDGASRWLTKKSYFVDRRTELISHILRCSPIEMVDVLSEALVDREETARKLVSYAVGVAFGRWLPSNIDKGAVEQFASDPFGELPAYPPAARVTRDSKGILVSSGDYQKSFSGSVERSLKEIWPNHAFGVEQDVSAVLGVELTEYLSRDFFKHHLSQYSKSRRSAPIYWPISTSSGSYILWLYYPSLTDQTLFSAVNDFIEPKLKEVAQDATVLRNKGSARSAADEKSLERLQSLETELIELRETLLEIAPSYRPNHDDGVQITAAPLWRLFRHRPWQNALKTTWEKLEKGDYDWAHLAMSYWPDRVREKCKTDKSLAIAHDLEALYEEPETGGAS